MISDNFTNVNTFRLIFNCLGIGSWDFEKNEIIDTKYNTLERSDSYKVRIYDLLDEELSTLENNF